MKKFLTLMVFMLAIGFSSQDALAQQRPEDTAKMKVAEITETLNLNGEQQRALFRVFVKKEAAYDKQVAGKDLNNASVLAAKKEIDATFEKELKATLTAEQYQKYKATIEK
ncbi:hypothetical protein [Planktosalinus lacus]|uniref:Peptidylprolyl isomerase n=1 Tax=Planktosalinus lacus TaxID=1526573 RepID=A0A8J2V9B7_9FLAO|nr:hypothetical protein [Planktosalinus lacus]GGD86872.1 hypothetical protein GCM10011312_08630 [Planktosalinus lacus]